MSNPIDVSGKESFETEVLKSDLPVLVDFWAPWCGPCQMMAPILEQLAQSMADKLKIVKVDTEVAVNQSLAMEYDIRSIPNMKLFVGGKVVKDFVGYRSREQFEAELKQVLSG